MRNTQRDNCAYCGWGHSYNCNCKSDCGATKCAKTGVAPKKGKPRRNQKWR